jgi:hypothetical protein
MTERLQYELNDLCSYLCFQWLFQTIQGLSLLFSSVIILQMVGPLGHVISLSQDCYLNTGQHTHTPNTHALSGIRTHDPSDRRQFHALDCAATVTGMLI